MAKPREKAAAKAATNAAAAASRNGNGQHAEEAAERLDVRSVSFGLGDMGQGFLALAVCVYSGALAYYKFRQVTGRSYVSGE